ncbi:MAG: FAD-dependent oxidoreductase, partial [Candidatus Binatia bacterium]
MGDKKKILIIGGGVAGMAAASSLKALGFDVTLVEREPALGGHVSHWGRVFPSLRPAEGIVSGLKAELDGVHILTNSDVKSVRDDNGVFKIDLDNRVLQADAILVATGYRPFDAALKEEFGYGVYRDVVTSVELERMIKDSALKVPSTGKVPEAVAINHCVGSRDKKVGNIYCSRV